MVKLNRSRRLAGLFQDICEREANGGGLFPGAGADAAAAATATNFP